MKQLVKQLVPPILMSGARLVRDALSPSPSDAPELEYVSDGWDHPLDQRSGQIWNTDKIADVEASKWKAYCQNLENGKPLGFSHEHPDPQVTKNLYFHNIHITFTYVLACAALGLKEVKVLDVGGGLGHYYMLAKSALPNVKLNYVCFEVPKMCEKGRSICPEVFFTSDEKCFSEEYDLVMVNGSLGYFRDWKALLKNGAHAARKYFFVTRVLNVQRSPGFVVLHRMNFYGYDTEMLAQVFNRGELLDCVKDSGFQLEREFVIGSMHVIKGAPEKCEDTGWLFRKAV